MPVITAAALAITDDDRDRLERVARSTSLPLRTVRQANALIMAADGVPNEEIARASGVDSDAVRRWRRRFEQKGVGGVGVSPREEDAGRGCQKARWPRLYG
jgi:Winged helix-turn helix